MESFSYSLKILFVRLKMLEKDVFTTFANKSCFFFSEFAQTLEESEKWDRERSVESFEIYFFMVF